MESEVPRIALSLLKHTGHILGLALGFNDPQERFAVEKGVVDRAGRRGPLGDGAVVVGLRASTVGVAKFLSVRFPPGRAKLFVDEQASLRLIQLVGERAVGLLRLLDGGVDRRGHRWWRGRELKEKSRLVSFEFALGLHGQTQGDLKILVSLARLCVRLLTPSFLFGG